MPRRGVAVIVFTVLSFVGFPSAGVPAEARPTGRLTPPAGALFGAYVPPPSGWTQADVKAGVESLEAGIGRTLDIDHHYYPWAGAFPSWKEPWDLAAGRTPMLSWGGTSTTDVNQGKQDAWISARADALKALGSPVFVRWFADMDRPPNAKKTVSPSAFVSAWQRIHDLFVSRGATNAVWVWCPTAYGFQTGSAQAYYPGDAYVDWICADGYNWAPGLAGAGWTSFASIFSPFYGWAAPKGKPLMIGETGAQERAAGEKAQWMTDARTALETTFPAVEAFLYQDSATPYDWRVNTSQASYDAYKAMAADRYFDHSDPGALLGAYVQPQTGWTKVDVQNAVGKLESDIGRTLDIDSHYYRWGLAFPSWKEPWDAATGRISMISWGGTYSTQIESGSVDSEIAARADAVKAFGKPLLLRYFWEMDAPSSADRAGSPADFVGAWRHLHDIFVTRGATNALWVWCPNAWAFDSGKAADYYPGDAYVDWICADGYNWSPTRVGSEWTTFADIFSGFYAWAAPKGKPLIVGETGAQERFPGEKSQWIQDAATAVENAMPAVHAVVYFDAKYGANFAGIYDWRLDTSTTSYDAFRLWGADPYFAPIHGSLVLGA